MTPEEISALATEERKRKAAEKLNSAKKPFNPFDWMEFTNTRKWMKHHLALSDKFYSYLLWVLVCDALAVYIYLDGMGSKLRFYAAASLTALFFLSCIAGFIYGYLKARRSK